LAVYIPPIDALNITSERKKIQNPEGTHDIFSWGKYEKGKKFDGHK